MVRTNGLDWVFLVLLTIGGINWGLVGLFDFNLVSALFGTDSLLTNVVYTLVGAAGVYVLSSFLMKNDNLARR